MNYTIQCFVKKVVLDENGVKSLTIRPTGKSRIDGVENQCLGLKYTKKTGDDSGEKTTLSQVKLFPLDLVLGSPADKKADALGEALMGAKFHGCEIEMEVEVKGGKSKDVKICGVTLL